MSARSAGEHELESRPETSTDLVTMSAFIWYAYFGCMPPPRSYLDPSPGNAALVAEKACEVESNLA